MNIDLKDKLIVGLDLPNVKEAEKMIATLSDVVNFYKIGHQLAFCGGLELAQDLIKDGKKVFLDLKLLDIDNTIEKSVINIAKLNVDMLTVHAYPKTMAAAAKAAKGSNLCVLGVTVLTSMDNDDLKDAGYNFSSLQLVEKRARQAKEAGIGGVVASGQEAKMVRSILGDNMAIVTPGIRLANDDKGDQKRVITPYQAIKNGASHIVVSRPIIKSSDPKAKAFEFLQKISQN